MALPFAGLTQFCLSRQWDGFAIDLGLVVEDRPTELSCIILIIIKHCQSYTNMDLMLILHFSVFSA